MFRNKFKFDDIVIIDFGLSTFLNANEYIYTNCGTVGFVAPEIISFNQNP